MLPASLVRRLARKSSSCFWTYCGHWPATFGISFWPLKSPRWHMVHSTASHFLACRHLRGIGRERDRLRLLRREEVAERDHLVAREVGRHRRHLRIRAPALLEVAQLEIDVAPALSREHGIARVGGIAVRAVAREAGLRELAGGGILLRGLLLREGGGGEDPRRSGEEEGCGGFAQFLSYGSANTKTLLPRFESIWLLPPAATATYCLPPTMYDTAGALTPEPQLNFHSSLPVFASNALNQPFASPLKTRFPAVASTPPMSGCGVLCFHAILPVSRFTATSCPHCSSVGIVLNAPPSQSLPPGYAASSHW